MNASKIRLVAQNEVERGIYAASASIAIQPLAGVPALKRAEARAPKSRCGRLQTILCVLIGFPALNTQAQNDANEIPHLHPVHAELPPTFWEQHGVLILVSGIILACLLALMIWSMTRPQPPVVTPPEVKAREALQALPADLAEGTKLSRVSQILRDYVRQAFDLPKEELTTREFCRALGANQQIGPELAVAVANFLRDNDRRKFSADASAPPPLNAVTVALSLIEKGEARRASLRAAQATPRT